MAKKPQSAGVYCRLSYSPDGSVEKVDRQEADSRQLADRLAWPINESHVYKDNNRSAWQRSRKRPGWDALLTAIENGEIDAVIVYHGDRLIRQPRDLETLIGIAETKSVRLASVTGTRNLDSSDDRYILRIEAAGFCRASDDASRRIIRSNDARASRGLPRSGGPRAFGFEPDNITIRQSEADLITEAADRILAGEGTYATFKWFRDICLTSTGKRWRLNRFKDMIVAPRLAGILERKGEWSPAAWEPIIEPAAWRDLRSILTQRGEAFESYGKPQSASKVKYLLSGIARCGTCKGAMPAKGTRKVPAYSCMNTGCAYQMSRSMKMLDAYVSGRTLQVLNDPKFIATLFADQASASNVAAEIAVLERRKAEAEQELEALADNPKVNLSLGLKSIATFDKKIQELRDSRAAGARQRLLAKRAGITREQWEAEPLDLRRATIAALFTLEVLPVRGAPGKGFNPDSVTLALIEDE